MKLISKVRINVCTFQTFYCDDKSSTRVNDYVFEKRDTMYNAPIHSLLLVELYIALRYTKKMAWICKGGLNTMTSIPVKRILSFPRQNMEQLSSEFTHCYIARWSAQNIFSGEQNASVCKKFSFFPLLSEWFAPCSVHDHIAIFYVRKIQNQFDWKEKPSPWGMSAWNK